MGTAALPPDSVLPKRLAAAITVISSRILIFSHILRLHPTTTHTTSAQEVIATHEKN